MQSSARCWIQFRCSKHDTDHGYNSRFVFSNAVLAVVNNLPDNKINPYTAEHHAQRDTFDRQVTQNVR